MAYFIRGQKQYQHHFVGIFMVIVGVAIVGIVSASGGSGETSILGILLLLLA